MKAVFAHMRALSFDWAPKLKSCGDLPPSCGLVALSGSGQAAPENLHLHFSVGNLCGNAGIFDAHLGADFGSDSAVRFSAGDLGEERSHHISDSCDPCSLTNADQKGTGLG